MKTIKIHIIKKASVAMLTLAIATSGAFAQSEKNHTTQQRKSSRTIVKSNNNKKQSTPQKNDARYEKSNSSSKHYNSYTTKKKPSSYSAHRNSKIVDSKSAYEHNKHQNSSQSYNRSDYEKYDHRYKNYSSHSHGIKHHDISNRHYSHFWSQHFPRTKIHHFSYHYEPKFYRHNFCRRLPRKSVYLELDGVGLFYYKGKFYYPVANGYYKVKAPMYIQNLPLGSSLELVHGKPYYHYHGIHFSLTSRGFRLHI